MTIRTHHTFAYSLVSLLLTLSSFVAWSAEPSAKPAAPEVTEQDLQRVVRAPLAKFSWAEKAEAKKKAAVQPKAPEAADPTAALPEMSGGDIIVKCEGPFTREMQKIGPEGGIAKEKMVLTLTQNVIIEQLQAHTVVRAQKIRVVQDPVTGTSENFQAEGSVELYTPDLKGRGEKMNFELREADANGNGAKEMFTLDGGPGGKATLWQGTDVIEAERFIRDAHIDTFRAIGHPAAVVTLPEEAAAPGKKVGMMPGLSMSNSGKVRLQSDGELFFDKAAGRMRIARNVIIQQQAMQMNSDEAIMLMGVDPAQTAEGAGVFSGSLKSLECNGRVEIKTPEQTVQCDSSFLNMDKNTFLMTMKNPADAVRVFQKGEGKIMVAPTSLKMNMDTGEFESPGAMRTESFSGEPPSNRSTSNAPEKARVPGALPPKKRQ